MMTQFTTNEFNYSMIFFLFRLISALSLSYTQIFLLAKYFSHIIFICSFNSNVSFEETENLIWWMYLSLSPNEKNLFLSENGIKKMQVDMGQNFISSMFHFRLFFFRFASALLFSLLPFTRFLCFRFGWQSYVAYHQVLYMDFCGKSFRNVFRMLTMQNHPSEYRSLNATKNTLSETEKIRQIHKMK